MGSLTEVLGATLIKVQPLKAIIVKHDMTVSVKVVTIAAISHTVGKMGTTMNISRSAPVTVNPITMTSTSIGLIARITRHMSRFIPTIVELIMATKTGTFSTTKII